ncbi:unnamed protein product [Schistosoma spindalis]|nr:unnamed protein product [Schistosoma spindale]
MSNFIVNSVTCSDPENVELIDFHKMESILQQKNSLQSQKFIPTRTINSSCISVNSPFCIPSCQANDLEEVCLEFDEYENHHN